jgi:outer membrane protein
VQGEKIKHEVDEKAKAFKTAREEFEKKKDVMDEKARNKRLKELQDMQNEGEKLIMESNAKLSKLSQELSAPLVEKIIEIVKRIGKDDKFDYVFERDKGGIVFANDKEDLTERIISELNKVTPKK